MTRTPERGDSPPVDPVLVVEDHDETREMLETVLKFHGYSVETARDGAEALEKLRDLHPCLILLDLTMPVMDGWAFRRRQLTLPAIAGVPVLLVTGHESDAKTEALHADGIVMKPVDFQVLIGAVARSCLR
jgi:CheY-like chemotaxis protein